MLRFHFERASVAEYIRTLGTFCLFLTHISTMVAGFSSVIVIVLSVSTRGRDLHTDIFPVRFLGRPAFR